MGSQPSIAGRGWLRAGGVLSLGALTLAAQGLPALPPLESLPVLPGQGELLPLRPMGLAADKDRNEPLRIRGKNVQEANGGWSLDDGAVESKDMLLLADHIRYSQITGQIEASGHIRLEGPGLRLRCERLRMDWSKRVGEAWALELELAPSWTLRSDKVEFNTLQHWEFNKVVLSPCPEVKPGWQATVSKLTVDLDHYARLRNLWIWVFGMPTYYFIPWAIYPAKAERTSGLLPVSLSFSGAQGASLAVPYYQVLGSRADLTFTPQYFTKQGTLWGSDLRWNPEPTHKGEFTGEFINQRSDHARRYEFSLKELWQREDGWEFTADINRASDNMVDSDYGSGVVKVGGTPFDSSTYLGKNFAWGNFNVTAAQQKTYFQPNDPFYQANFPSSMRKENLPTFQTTFFPVPLGDFYLDGAVKAGRLGYNLDLGSQTNGMDSKYTWQRGDALVRLAGRLGQWGPFRTDLQVAGRFTHYSATLGASYFDADHSSLGSGSDASAASPFIVNGPNADRILGSARLQFSAPSVGRAYPNARVLGYAGDLKHVLEPYFALSDTSRSSSEGTLPHFDGVDSQPGVAGAAAGEQSVELGVKQHLFGQVGGESRFLDLVRWRTSAKYNFRTILLPDGRYQHGWGSLDNDLDVEPGPKLHLHLHSSNDLTDSRSDNSISAEYQPEDGTRLHFSLFSTGLNQLLERQRGFQVGGLQRIWSDNLRLEASADYDFAQRCFSTSQVALAYVQPCVSESIRYSHLAVVTTTSSIAKEDRVDLVITLRGLGDLFKMGF